MARKSSLTERQKADYAARIAAGGATYESISRELGRDSTGLKKLLAPLVEKLRGEAGDVAEKVHDAVQSIQSLPAPLKKNSIGLLETLLTTLDGDFANYMANASKIANHTAKLAIKRLSDAGANPTVEDLSHVAMLSRIGRENASPVLDAARIMGEAATKGRVEAPKTRRIIVTARKQ